MRELQKNANYIASLPNRIALLEAEIADYEKYQERKKEAEKGLYVARENDSKRLDHLKGLQEQLRKMQFDLEYSKSRSTEK